jgi:hypothetical protein
MDFEAAPTYTATKAAGSRNEAGIEMPASKRRRHARGGFEEGGGRRRAGVRLLEVRTAGRIDRREK